MKVTALAGGVGGAKLLVGLQRIVGDQLTAIVNTGDDATIYGVHVSPDVDIVTYWLAGIADTQKGWGIHGDTFTVVEALRLLGEETWFSLGDRDLATCIYRTVRLRGGATLSAVTDEIARSLEVATRVVPMSDDPVRTMVVTTGGVNLGFQEYFVRERTKPEVAEVFFEGIAEAKPSPDVVPAIEDADAVVLCPSNPLVSIAPILALPGVRAALRRHPRVTAVTPIVRGATLKGPADRMMRSMGVEPCASTVAGTYADLCDAFVVDESDRSEIEPVAALGIRAVALDTIMTDHDAAQRLAEQILSS